MRPAAVCQRRSSGRSNSSSVSTGAVSLSALLLGLHGTAFVLAGGWLVKRQFNWQLRDLLRRAPAEAAA